MRILVCGSRDWNDKVAITSKLSEFTEICEYEQITIVHGDARGADTIAGEVAHMLGYEVEAHPANWDKYGKSAGPRRNIEMLDSGVDIVLAFMGPNSIGTQHTVREAKKRGIPTEVMEDHANRY